MRPIRALLPLLAALTLLAPVGSAAQERGTRLTLTASLTSVDFGTWGGPLGAVAAQVGISQRLNETFGADLVALAVAPAGGVAVTPACVQGSVCESRQTPSLFSGAVLTPHARLGSRGLRLAAGGGYLRALGGAGRSERGTATAALSAEWRPAGRSRLAPTIGVRWLRFASPVMGARQLILPGIGLAL